MKTTTHLLSVIVPVYNVECYLKTCLNSIINQTYPDLEVILVNDGSTDQSVKICEEYARIDSRIKLISKRNGGLSSARNAGLDIATGDYVTFVDSDDYIDLNTYSLNMKILIEDRDICMLQFPVERQGKIYGIPEKPYTISEEKNIFSNWWTNDIITSSVCNKIFRKDVFETIRFPQGQTYEDHFLIVDFSETIQTVYLSREGCYHYETRENSITTSNITINRCIDFYKAHAKVYIKLYSYEELRLYRLMAFSRVYRKLITARRIDHKMNLDIYINELQKYEPTWKDIFKTKSKIKEKIWVSCVKITGIRTFMTSYSKYLNIKRAKKTL